MPGGGFVMGSGNSVTNFCKVENYFAMLDEDTQELKIEPVDVPAAPRTATHSPF